MKAIICAVALLALGGCGSGTPEEIISGIMAPEPPAKVTVKTSTFCRQTTQINAAGQPEFVASFDIMDTPDTATGVQKLKERWTAANCAAQFAPVKRGKVQAELGGKVQAELGDKKVADLK